jgi:hypothetical protein
MFARSLILVAALAVSAVTGTAALSQIAPSSTTGGQPISPPPTLPDVPPLLPSTPPPGLPRSTGAPSSPGQFAPAPNPGPVTGYGPGGLAPVPGAPANPPYSYGPPR